MAERNKKKIDIMTDEINRLFNENIIDDISREILLRKVESYVINDIYTGVYARLKYIDDDLKRRGAYDGIISY